MKINNERNECKVSRKHRDTMIRLICIEGDTRFKYKRCSEIRRQSRNGYQSSGEGAIEGT